MGLTMKRWLWAAAACLVGTSAANAEYAIIRVWLNKNVNPNEIPDGLNPPEAEAQRRLNRAFQETRSLILAFRVQEGLGLDLSVGFDPQVSNATASSRIK